MSKRWSIVPGGPFIARLLRHEWGTVPGAPFIARTLRDERDEVATKAVWGRSGRRLRWPSHRVLCDGWGTAAALLAGLLLRAYFVLHHAQFGGDALVYGDLAHNLRLHHIFGFTPDPADPLGGIRPTLIRLPGYPLFLAACFALFGEGNYTAVLWIQVAMDLATCWLLSRLAQHVWVAHSSRALCAMSGEQDGWPVHRAHFARCTGESGDGPTGGPFTPSHLGTGGPFMPSHLGHEWGTAGDSGAPSVPLYGTGGRRASTLTLWLACLCPFTANYAAVPITECLTLFCITFAFYAFTRFYETHIQIRNGVGHGFSRDNQTQTEGGGFSPGGTAATLVGANAGPWPILLGLSLALAVLLRPDRALLAAAVLPAMLWLSLRHPPRTSVSSAPSAFAVKLLPAATTTAILLLPLALWAARNERVFHVFQPLAPRYANDPGEPVPLGFQRWYRTWAIDFQSTVDIYWAYDATPLRLDALPARAFDSPAQHAATQALFATYNQTTSATPELDAGFSSLASARIAAHPVRFYLWLPAARVLDMALRPRTELMRLPVDWWNFRSHPGASTFELVYALLNAAYLTLALLGLYRRHNIKLCHPEASRGPRRAFFARWGGLPKDLLLKRRHLCTGSQNALVASMLAFVALRAILLLTLDNSEPRYTLDLFPVVILLAGQSLSSPRPTQTSQNNGNKIGIVYPDKV